MKNELKKVLYLENDFYQFEKIKHNSFEKAIKPSRKNFVKIIDNSSIFDWWLILILSKLHHFYVILDCNLIE